MWQWQRKCLEGLRMVVMMSYDLWRIIGDGLSVTLNVTRRGERGLLTLFPVLSSSWQ